MCEVGEVERRSGGAEEERRGGANPVAAKGHGAEAERRHAQARRAQQPVVVQLRQPLFSAAAVLGVGCGRHSS
jgi:hypothetical protein